MKRMAIRHDMTGLHCAAIMHVAAADTADQSGVAVCPKIASHVQESYFLRWQELTRRNLLELDKSCKCPPRAPVELTRDRLVEQVRKSAGNPEASGEIARALDINREKVELYRASVVGQSGLIIGTGPSLNTVDLREWRHVTTIGCNKLFLLDKRYLFRPTHYMVEDRLLLEDCADEIADYNGSIRWAPLDRLTLNQMECYFPLWRSYEGFPRFSSDAVLGLFAGWTVTFCMLQLAAYLGLKRIALIGVDGTYNIPSADYEGSVGTSKALDTNHFDQDYYGPGTRFHAPEQRRVDAAYSLAATALAHAGIEVINCSPNSAISSFKKGSMRDALGA